MKFFFIETYGCQMNVAESSAIELQLKKGGWLEANRPEEASIVIINTCSVRKTAENRIWGRLGYYKQLSKNNNFKLFVIGCMAERLKDKIKTKFPIVNEVISNYKKNDLIQIIEKDKTIVESIAAENVGFSTYHFFDNHNRISSTHSMIPIMNGCNNFCTYCIVPYVRGREISRNSEEIIKEILIAQQNGISEITLLGQNVNSYSYKTMSFTGLLSKILNETDIRWLRFTSSNPQDFSDELIDLIEKNSRICSTIHLPAQHGSDKILKKMNRKYNSDEYLKLSSRLKSLERGISLTTDLMVGFPGETEKDYQLLLEFVKKVRFEEAFTYYYNPREGTAAYEFGNNVEHEIKLKRLSNLIELQRRIGLEEKQKHIGSIVEAVIEGVSKKDSNKILARTEKNSMVVFPKSNTIKDKYVTIKLIELIGNTFIGEVLNV